MELTRRNAVLAVLAAGAGVGAVRSTGVRFGHLPGISVGARHPRDHDVATMIAVAGLIFPPGVDDIPGLVEGHVADRSQPYRRETRAAVEELDRYAVDRRGRRFIDLPVPARDDLLHGIGVHLAEANPEGSPVERIRYYLVNGLLYALFTSPAGSELLGIDNPLGYPGGYGSYREAP